MNLFSTGWFWFGLYWIIALVFIVRWHFFAYGRVAFMAIYGRAHCTMIGIVIPLSLSAAIVGFFNLQNFFGVLVIVFVGQRFVRPISCFIHDYPNRKRERRFRREVESAGGLDAYYASQCEESHNTDPANPWVKATVRRRPFDTDIPFTRSIVVGPPPDADEK